ncbi:MAG: helix-turn-helix transcriptional regulator [Bryobacteraceae bacterium]|nr:helix-turn-helix transcriptional regulator [Bryobacteraceae bacterium]
MADVLQWRKRNGLTQVNAASLLGVSQPYLSLLEKGARPLTAALCDRMKVVGGEVEGGTSDDRFRAQLSALGYPGFVHVVKSRPRPRAADFLLAVLARPDADARVVEALPWLVGTCQNQLDLDWLVRQAKLQNLQNRLGFLLQVAGVDTPECLLAVRKLERARLLQEDTLCWDSMPAATREWMRANRTPLAERWNVLTRLRAEDVHDAV